MVDTEAKKILGGRWADTGDRTDPDDPSLTPPIVRNLGYPVSFSADAGDTPRRREINQKFRENDGIAYDVMTEGVLFWDVEIDYLLNAFTSSLGRLYRATVATGPASSNATDPDATGQTVWELVSGEVGAPTAPSMPTGAGTNGQIVWSWNCPLDGGAAITHFVFEWRVSGGSFVAVSPNPTVPRFVLTGLTNGLTYEVRVYAVNSIGDSAYSATGSASPVAQVPGGGSTLAVRAAPGDGEAALSWLEPDDGGAYDHALYVPVAHLRAGVFERAARNVSNDYRDGHATHEWDGIFLPGAREEFGRRRAVVERRQHDPGCRCYSATTAASRHCANVEHR